MSFFQSQLKKIVEVEVPLRRGKHLPQPSTAIGLYQSLARGMVATAMRRNANKR